jgi:hypothetical protein
VRVSFNVSAMHWECKTCVQVQDLFN